MLLVDFGLVGGSSCSLLLKAVGVGLSLSALYVGSLYLVDKGLPRDHPTTIKRRILAVSAVTLASPFLVYAAYRSPSSALSVHAAPQSLWTALFLRPSLAHHTIATSKALALFGLLFAGPLVHDAVDGEHVRTWRRAMANKLIALRNYVVGPITEEIVYRSCVTVPLIACFGPARLYAALLLGPLFFGVAHAHHYFEGVPLLNILVQVAFTSVFGFLSGLVMVHTESVVAAIATHAFCNWCGLPPFADALGHSRRHVLVPIYVLGLAGFVGVLSTNAGVSLLRPSS